MRNKGFFWFLTILLTVVCIYQLSFTWVSSSVERKAEKEAQTRVNEEWEKRDGADSLYLPNGTAVSYDDPAAKELAKAAYVNDILKQKADTPVYPLFGSTFKEVKKRSLALGLDLVGGMSVTLEVSMPDLLASYARSTKDLDFRKVYKAAKKVYDENGGEFVDLFSTKYDAIIKDQKMVKMFAIADIDELGIKSTNEEVIDFLRDQEAGAMDGVEEIMNRRINQFGVAQPNIQKDPANNRLYIELPGVMDEKTVADKLKSTANLQFYETYRFSVDFSQQWEQAVAVSSEPERVDFDEPEVVDTIDTAGNVAVADPNDPDSIDTTKDKIEELTSLSGGSLDETKEGGQKGLRELIYTAGDSWLFVESANRGEVDKLLQREDVKREFNDDLRLMWSANLETLGEDKVKGYFLYPCKIPESGKALVGGKDIKSASRDYDQEDGEIAVSIRMTTEGADKWAQMTEENVDRIIAITMDNVVYSAPNVINPIRDGNTQISGSFSVQEADDLAGLLNGGALPTRCVIKEQTKVGPTIGAENSRAGLMSFGIALVLVFIYMIFYYGKAGVVADIALTANILFLFGSLASFGAVLTLAGIAGIVLTIGMAVDANVLIFERIREERAAGKDLKSAVDTGFKKALSSIIDANVTTMLTAVVLKIFGSGPIESFATTLIIGIFTSVFAALVITRLLINMWLKRTGTINFETKYTKNAFKNFNFNFVGKRKRFYLISGILIAGGIATLAFRGLNPSVEFSGGRTFGVKFEKSTEGHQDAIEAALTADFVDSTGKVASVETKTKSNSYYLEISTNYLRSKDNANEQVKEELLASLKKVENKVGKATVEESRSVSPTVSKELMKSSMIAIILSLIIIFTYILMRFGRWQYSTGAIVAMLHDVTLVLSVFALFHGILPFNMDIDQAFIAAILTVIGYSINDTVIVFDRIRENLRTYKGQDESATINRALNSTLSRTINTSMTTFIVLLMIFVFGGAAIKGFIFALMIGVIVGTYSSVCIATPILIDFSKRSKTDLKDKEPEVIKDAVVVE